MLKPVLVASSMATLLDQKQEKNRRPSAGSLSLSSGPDEESGEDNHSSDSEQNSPQDQVNLDLGESNPPAVLIVSFFHSNSAPTFTVRSLYETKVTLFIFFYLSA